VSNGAYLLLNIALLALVCV